jgi:hypothetical protein
MYRVTPRPTTGGRSMAISPARIRKMLSAMDQPMDLRGIEEQAVDASFAEVRSFIDGLQKLRRSVRYQAPRIPWEPPFLDNGDIARISGLRAVQQ